MPLYTTDKDSTEVVSRCLLDVIQKFSIAYDSYIASLGDYDHFPLWELYRNGFLHLYGFSDVPEVYDLPFYHRIRYQMISLPDSHLPSFMFHMTILFLNHTLSSDRSAIRRYIDEAIRISKDNALIILIQNKTENFHSPFEDMPNYGLNAKHPIAIIEVIQSEYKCLDAKGLTFHVMKVRKKEEPASFKRVKIIAPTLGKNEGQSEYAIALSERFKEAGIPAFLASSEGIGGENDTVTIMEFEPHLKKRIPDIEGLVLESHYLPKGGISITKNQYLLLKLSPMAVGAFRTNRVSTFLTYLSEFFRNPSGNFAFLKNHLLGRIENMGTKDGSGMKPSVQEYFLVPHINWHYQCDFKVDTYAKEDEFVIGSFGFARPQQRFELTCKLAKRLGVRAKLLLSIPNTTKEEEDESMSYARSLKRKYSSDKIDIRIEFFSPCEILMKLSSCTHIISTQMPLGQTSGSMRLAALTGRPVISLDNLQAKDSQAYRVKSIRDIDLNYLRTHTSGINIDDGFYYLLNFLIYDWK